MVELQIVRFTHFSCNFFWVKIVTSDFLHSCVYIETGRQSVRAPCPSVENLKNRINNCKSMELSQQNQRIKLQKKR